jgi:ubiquitin carboxyl-terminal hydrolase 8
MFDIIDKSNSSNLYNMFGLHTTINIKCKMSSCLKESEHIEKDVFLHLPITSDLSDSYRKYKSFERLQGDSAYECENCKRKTIARRKTTTSKWPDNLIIVLKRFDNMMNKNNMDINIPLEWRHGYKLKGGIIHIGSYGGGHYIYYGNENNKWYLANDSNISNINNINEIASKSYILYYIK